MGNPDASNSPYFQALYKISHGEEELSLGETIRSFSDRKPVNLRKVGAIAKLIKEKTKDQISKKKA